MDAFFVGSLYLLLYLAVDTYIVVLLVVRQFCRKGGAKFISTLRQTGNSRGR